MAVLSPCLLLVRPASATTSGPSITHLTPSFPIVASTGGPVELSASISNAASCTLSTTPAVPGSPSSASCLNGVFSATLSLPANTSRHDAVYKFKLEATSGMLSATSSVTVRVAPPLTGVRSIVSDAYNTGYCALMKSSQVDCWGYNLDGELGNGNTVNQASPTPVIATTGSGHLTGVRADVNGYLGYCALLISGHVDCWGLNDAGSLGAGDDAYDNSDLPRPVLGVGGNGQLGGVVALTTNSIGYCALLTGGNVDCWGPNHEGQLGNNTHDGSAQFLQDQRTYNFGSSTPVQVLGIGGTGLLSGVAQVVSGPNGQGYCAVLLSGGVDCWGLNRFGALGNGVDPDLQSDSPVPVAVVGTAGVGALSDVTAIVGGNWNSGFGGYCALLRSHSVDCWGYNLNGDLGNGTTTNADHPTPVVGLGGVGSLSGVRALVVNGNSGSYDSTSFCALLLDHEAACWGTGSSGELGDNQSINSAVPVPVTSVDQSGPLTNIEALTGGVNGTFCARLTTGAVDCWGVNGGALGNGTLLPNSSLPTQVIGTSGAGALTGVRAMASDGAGFCALTRTQQVNCWGFAYYGGLGDGQFDTTSPYILPTPVWVASP